MRTVTELDFRMPEYKDAKPEDYEFRNDGKLVRKDRWKTGINKIRHRVGIGIREDWEIKDVILKVEKLATPLSAERIEEISRNFSSESLLAFVRAIEREHGVVFCDED